MDVPDAPSVRVLGRRLDAGWLGLGILLAASAALILYLGRGFNFYSDEWYFVLYEEGNTVHQLLVGYGGHLVPFPILLFVQLFWHVGLDHYWVYRAIAVVPFLACGALVYVLARPRVGALLALAPAGLLLFLGSGWNDVLRPFQITFTMAIVSGLLALVLLDRDDLPGDVAALLALLFGFGWSAAAVPFVAAVAAGLIVKRRFWRRLWLPLIPALIYPVWSPRYSDIHTDYAENIAAAPLYALRMAEAGVEGVTGWPHPLAIVLTIVVAAAAATGLWALRRADALAWEALAGALAFWGATALSQAQEKTPDASRYLYASAVFLLLLAVGLAVGRRVSRLALAVIAALLLLLAVPTNLAALFDGAAEMHRTAQYESAELGAVEIAREVISPEYTPPLQDLAGVTIPAGFYLGIVGRYHSSPADTPEEILEEPDFARRRVDEILAMAFAIETRPRPTGVSFTACRPVAAGERASFEVPAGGLGVRTREGVAGLALRQYASTFAVGLGKVEEGEAVLRPDRRSLGPRPWRLLVLARGAAAEVCGLRGGAALSG